MLRDAFLAFDDEIRGSTTVYTDDSLAVRLGAWERLFVGMTVFNPIPGAGSTISLTLEHSGDASGRIAGSSSVNWTTKLLNITGGNTTLASWSPGTFFVWGQDWGTMPKLRFARIGITPTGTFTSAWIRLYVAARDGGGGWPFGLERPRE